jgi:hypothetical protein
VSRSDRIWQRILRKKIGQAHLSRKIVVTQEGPSDFKVVQDYELGRLRRFDNARTLPQSAVDCYEWSFSTRVAALEQAERCVRESERDAWELLPASSLLV